MVAVPGLQTGLVSASSPVDFQQSDWRGRSPSFVRCRIDMNQVRQSGTCLLECHSAHEKFWQERYFDSTSMAREPAPR